MNTYDPTPPLRDQRDKEKSAIGIVFAAGMLVGALLTALAYYFPPL